MLTMLVSKTIAPGPPSTNILYLFACGAPKLKIVSYLKNASRCALSDNYIILNDKKFEIKNTTFKKKSNIRTNYSHLNHMVEKTVVSNEIEN